MHCIMRCKCVIACREVYHTKRMQRVITVQWSLDNKFIVSGSDEMNLRVWKANSSAKLGVVCIFHCHLLLQCFVTALFVCYWVFTAVFVLSMCLYICMCMSKWCTPLVVLLCMLIFSIRMCVCVLILWLFQLCTLHIDESSLFVMMQSYD